MPVQRYSDFQRDLSTRRNTGPIVDMELGADGTYRPVTQPGPPGPLATRRPRGRPAPARGVGAPAVGMAIDAVCLARQLAPDGFLRDLVDASPFDVIPGVRNARERMISALCEETPGGQPPLSTPVAGGQCSGVSYRIGYVITYPLGDGTTVTDTRTSSRTWIGPIGSLIARGTDDGSSYRWDLSHDLNLSTGPRVDQLGSVGSPFGKPSLSITTIVRVDGLPDDCGEGPPAYEPDSGPSLLPDLNIDIPIGNGNTINVGIDVGLDIDGRLTIEFGDTNVTFDGDDIDIDYGAPDGDGGSIPPIDVDIELCPPSGPDNSEPDTDTPITPRPPSDPPAPPGAPDGDRIIRGAYVTLSSGLGGSTEVLPNNGAPPAFFPDLGIVMFQVLSPDGQLGWTPPERLQVRQGYYECPSFFGAVDVKVTTRPSLTATIRRVYYRTVIE